MQLGNHVGLNIVKISGILVYIEIHLIDAPSKGVVVQQQQQTCVSIQSRLALPYFTRTRTSSASLYSHFFLCGS
jgi:hypothetical protein